MKTIKEGVLPEDRVWWGYCPSCGWEGEAQKKELDPKGWCCCPTEGCGCVVVFVLKHTDRQLTADIQKEEYLRNFEKSGAKYKKEQQ